MTKKGALLLTLFVSLILVLSLVIAADGDVELTTQEKAVQWLQEYVDTTPCDDSDFSIETKSFILMAIDECESELIDDATADNCWGEEYDDTDCDIKSTSQAILALEEASTSTSDAQDWLLEEDRSTSTSDLTWYLQIETEGIDATCIVSVEGESDVTLMVYENYEVSDGSGCFISTDSDYRFNIDENCFGKDITVSCGSVAFGTTTLFKKNAEETLYISESPASSSTGTVTTERVDSLCFTNNGRTCDYEATLWAAYTLDTLAETVYPYMPYLIAGAEDGNRLLAKAFLSRLTGYESYLNDALDLQTINVNANEAYWAVSNNEVYDTALGIYLTSPGDPTEQVENWVDNEQDEEGHWNNENVRDTAFLTYSIWGATGIGGGTDDTDGGDDTDEDDTADSDCENNNYFCGSATDCTDLNGEILGDYRCSFGYTCCSVETERTCAELSGIKCAYTDVCSGTENNKASDLLSTELCCVDGTCAAAEGGDDTDSGNACEDADGNCYASCDPDYNEVEKSSLSDSCEDNKICCVTDDGDDNDDDDDKSSIWIWVLLILIILVIVGIIFRDKLKPAFNKLFKKKPSAPSRSRGFPPRGPPQRAQQRQRTILPPSQPKAPRKMQAPNQEMDDVLKKLKDMGK
jgi:hypothetical protein